MRLGFFLIANADSDILPTAIDDFVLRWSVHMFIPLRFHTSPSQRNTSSGKNCTRPECQCPISGFAERLKHQCISQKQSQSLNNNNQPSKQPSSPSLLVFPSDARKSIHSHTLVRLTFSVPQSHEQGFHQVHLVSGPHAQAPASVP